MHHALLAAAGRCEPLASVSVGIGWRRKGVVWRICDSLCAISGFPTERFAKPSRRGVKSRTNVGDGDEVVDVGDCRITRT
jgi:hypothetical protein